MPDPSTALGALLSGSTEVVNTAAVAPAAKGLLGSCAAGLLAAKAPAGAGGGNGASARLHTTADATLSWWFVVMINQIICTFVK